VSFRGSGEPSPAEKNKAFLKIFEGQRVEGFIRNARVVPHSIVSGKETLPSFISSGDATNSYVCSLLSSFVGDPREELGLIKNPSVRIILKALCKPLELYLQAFRLDKHLSINNWLVSTNIPPHLTPESVRRLTDQAIPQFPSHLFAFRSVNLKTHPQLGDAFRQSGWVLVPARRVYLFEKGEAPWKKKSLVKRERKKLNSHGWVKVGPEALSSRDLSTILGHYNNLFLEKHSQFNPQLTLRYLTLLSQSGIIEFHALRKLGTGKLLGSFGVFTMHSIMSIPIIGYDPQENAKDGIYRLLVARILELAEERNQTLNLSSGAGEFKSLRGGKPVLEYTAFYIDHLSYIRRIGLRGFTKLVHCFGTGILEKNEI